MSKKITIAPRAFAALQAKAQALGISVDEAIKRHIAASAAHVVGANAQRFSREMPDSGKVDMTSKGDGAWNDVEDRLHPDQEDDFSDLVQAREKALVDAGGDSLAAEAIFLERNRALANEASPFQ